MNKKSLGLTITSSILGVIALLGLFFGIWWISVSNQINNRYQDCEQQWSQVENVMQRRADLIPNLTAAVKGSMTQEQKVFGKIAEARKAYRSADTPVDKMKADAELNQSTGMLINVIHENYPQLASNQRVADLMVQLEGSENRIAVERRNYIQDVRAYNQLIVNFPSSIVANAKNKKTLQYYQADRTAQKAPKVKFAFGDN